MKNDFYTLASYEKTRKQWMIYLFTSLGTFVFGIAFTLLSGFFIKEGNSTLIKVIDSIVLSASLCAAAYLYLDCCLPRRIRFRFIYQLLAVSRYEGIITIREIQGPSVIKRGITAYEISAFDDTGKEKTYYLESFLPVEFGKDDTVKVIIASGFITAYETEERHD